MKIKVSSGFSGVIATGSYENARPSYTAEIELDLIEQDGLNFSSIIETQQKILQDICLRNFKSDEEKLTVEKINRQRADFHWIDIHGKKAPSVTSVINFDMDMFLPPDEMQQYASQGNIIDLQGRHFVKTGKWIPAREIDDCWGDLVILKKGSLQLPSEGWDFPAFLEKFPIKDMRIAETSFNEEHFYGGTPDFIGVPMGWDKIKGFEQVKEVPTLFDWKRTAAEMKNGKQLAAYSRMKGYEEIKQAAVVELNDKTKQGWSKPLFYDNDRLSGFFKMFLQDRENFRKRFGI